jgi:phosphopantothenoylcysteine decarboxylase/phosphopantothenate--cysteine ligase
MVTAGPTCEDIDPVRFISNRSSGAMGYALAAAALARGDDVELISGPVDLEAPEGCIPTHVRTTRQMYDAVLDRYGDTDIVVMAAAVADFRPRRVSTEKIKKEDGGLVLELEQTEDILAELGRRKARQVLVGFALESPGETDARASGGLTESMRRHAEHKLREKNLDLIVLNGPSAIGAASSAIALLDRDAGWTDLGEASKKKNARAIIETARAIASRR